MPSATRTVNTVARWTRRWLPVCGAVAVAAVPVAAVVADMVVPPAGVRRRLVSGASDENDARPTARQLSSSARVPFMAIKGRGVRYRRSVSARRSVKAVVRRSGRVRV
ncbi:hypothetical protein Kpho01_38390 [Kitasatospora phosalacinea]|uniref:Uncharacterized protein n=1 Tax=Kitasatospora phosalacinea TaxID=2065 RepID=A0A9W6UPX2_9ACTN|nr:hypothetical protein Kpho01_38390 [Kitasatospora phosalacinea]